MSTEYEVVRVENLPVASSVSDKDSLLVWQGKNVKRVPPSLMKGKKGDPGDSTTLRYTGEWVQQKQGVNGAWINLIPAADITGPSAYELAVKNGYKGTQIEWLASLSQASEDAAKVALAAAAEAEKTNASVSEVERLRVEAERLRTEAENIRTQTETTRQKAEAGRVAEEAKRVLAETERTNGEMARQRAEEARFEAEQLRREAEDLRSEESAAAIENVTVATALANASASAAQETADHPTYIGSDHYVYKWNRETKAYDKTDIFVKGDAFSIRKVYESVKQMEGDLSNAQVKEGDFVLINTNDVEKPDNARLYIRTSAGFDFLVDMSGAIGFTGKTPQLGIGTVSSGETAVVSLSEDGTDATGNPKFKLNLILPKGQKGDTPVLRAGTVTTGVPGTAASAELLGDGVTEDGVPRYRLDLTIPRGDTGTGNVSVPATALKAGVTYLFKPSVDGSAEGEFIEYVAPVQVQSDWNESNATSDAFIQNKPALKSVATSGSYNDLTDKPTEIDSAKIANSIGSGGFLADGNNPVPINGLLWSNDSTVGFPGEYKHGNVLQISNLNTPNVNGEWSWINQILFGTNSRIYHRNFSNTAGWGVWARVAYSYEIPNLDNLTKSITINNAHITDGTKIGIGGLMSGNDCWGIYSYSFSNDVGALEIATGDNGTEPIYVRQYQGNPVSTPVSQVVRTAALLDENGNTSFPGTVSSGGQVLVKTNDSRLSNARPASGGTADYAGMINGIYTQNGGQQPPSYVPSGKVRFNMMNTEVLGDNTFKDWILMDTYTGGDVPVVTAIGISKSTTLSAYIMQGTKGGSTWERKAKLFHTGNLGTATSSVQGLMPAADKAKVDRLRRHAITTTCNALNVDYEVHYVTLSANVTLSISASGTAYNGRTVTAFIYCAAAQTIAIPTSGSYISMCGSSYTCPAGKWVEFNMVCVNGVWHIAMLEQE